MRSEEMRLDGNAAGGLLRELFARDVTAASATCAGCGTVRPLGALLDYGGPMGVVLRCPGCDAVLLRVARTPGWIRVDARGLALLAVPE
jgi:Family of unknown function (DUF6510)